MEKTKMSSRLFPMFIDLTGKRIVVIGGGTIAARRIGTLMQFTDQVTVIAPEVEEKILLSGASVIYKNYEPEDINGAWMVLACTNNGPLNEEIYHAAKAEHAWVNVCSDKTLCDFHFPGVVIHDNIVVGVNAGGNDHRGAKEARKKIAKLYED